MSEYATHTFDVLAMDVLLLTIVLMKILSPHTAVLLANGRGDVL